MLAQYGIKVKLFADNVKLHVKIVNRIDIRKFQLALSTLCRPNWAAEWQLGISFDKCFLITFGKGEIIDQFHIRDTPLPSVSSFHDFGIIIISNDLSSNAHINYIVFDYKLCR